MTTEDDAVKLYGYMYYCIVDENELQYLALVHLDQVTLWNLKNPNNTHGEITGSCIWTIKKEHNSDTDIRTIIYFKGRKIIAFSLKKTFMIDVISGTIEEISSQTPQKHIQIPILVLQNRCIENIQRHNADPYSEYSVVLINGYQLCSFAWKNNTVEIQIRDIVIKGNSVAFYEGKLWAAYARGISVYDVDMKNLTVTQISYFASTEYYSDIFEWKEGLIAVGSKYFFLNGKGECVREVERHWPHASGTIYHNKIVATSSVDLFDDYQDPDIDHCLHAVDINTGEAFSSKWKKTFDQSFLAVWKNTIFIFRDISAQPIEYRTGMLFESITYALTTSVLFPWSCKRLLWIGHLKNEPKECLLAAIPRDVVKEIQKYLIGDLSADTCNWPEVHSFQLDLKNKIPESQEDKMK